MAVLLLSFSLFLVFFHLLSSVIYTTTEGTELKTIIIPLFASSLVVLLCVKIYQEGYDDNKFLTFV